MPVIIINVTIIVPIQILEVTGLGVVAELLGRVIDFILVGKHSDTFNHIE